MNLKFLPLVGAMLGAATIASAATHVGIGLSFGVPPPVIVHRAPPPRVVERVVVAPGPGYVWVPGHYTWGNGQWLWLSGAWMLPPRPDAYWVDGRWDQQTHQWMEAHWEVSAPPAPPPPPVVATPSPAPVVVVPPPPVPAATEIVVNEAPPPPPAPEVIIERPGSGYVWIAGYWGWENGRRQWFRGHWERPPRGYSTWVAPRWEHRPHGYVYVRGYWH
jgi:hypothetical protein